MHPILFRIGDFPIGTYALMAMLGLAATTLVFSWLAARDGRDRMVFVEIALWAFVIGLGSAKIFGAAVAFDAERPWESVRHVLRYGGHYYIGVIGAVGFLVLIFRRMRVPLATGLDWLAPALALGHGIGRIGCFLAGCCYGKPCDLPWAVTFTDEAARLAGTPLGVPLHPTQLYESGAEILIAGILLWKHLRDRGRPGTTFLWYVVLYGSVRFIVEFLRDDPRGTFVGMPTSQPLAIASAVVAGCLLVILASSGKGATAAASAEPASPPDASGAAPAAKGRGKRKRS